MDRKQIAASIAGIGLIAASLFGAVAAAQGSGEVTVNNPPEVATEAAPAAVLVESVTSYGEQPEEYEEEEYEEYEDEEEDHEEYEDEEEDHEEYEDEEGDDEDHD